MAYNPPAGNVGIVRDLWVLSVRSVGTKLELGSDAILEAGQFLLRPDESGKGLFSWYKNLILYLG